MDSGVDDHLFLNEMIETAMCAERLDVVNIQAFEMVFRRLQLWEDVYGQQFRIAENGDAADPWWMRGASSWGNKKAAATPWWRLSWRPGWRRNWRRSPQ